MAAFTAIAAGTASLVSAGMSFSQAQKARNMQVQAQAEARRAISEAKKRLEVNYMDTLSVIKEPYELEREALLSSGAQAIEAAKESTRGVSETAGRIQMAQNQQQGNIRTAMGREVANLDMLSAREDSRLRDENVLINKDEISGAQLANANAWELQQKALQQGFAGVSSGIGQFAKLIPDNVKNYNLATGNGQSPKLGTNAALGAVLGGANTPMTNTPTLDVNGQPMGGNVDMSQLDLTQQAVPEMNGMKLNPAYQGLTYEQILDMLSQQKMMPANFDMASIIPLIYQ
jgi:hypothetical protein